MQIASPTFLSVSEIAAQLRVKADVVLNWINGGSLRAFDVSEKRAVRPRWRVRADDFEAFLSCRSSRSDTPAQPKRAKRGRRETKRVFFR